MNNILTTTGISIGVVCLFLLGAFLKYKNVNIASTISKLEAFLTQVESYTSALESMATGKAKKALEFTELLEKAGEKAINYSAQLLISGQISDDEDGSKRRETAYSYIFALLEKEGIKVDDNVKILARGIVESGILSNKTIQEINAQLDKLIQEKVTPLQKEKETIQAQLQTLQTQLTSITAERDSLKSAMTNITNTANSTVATTTNQVTQ